MDRGQALVKGDEYLLIAQDAVVSTRFCAFYILSFQRLYQHGCSPLSHCDSL
jgi:hypothetical protein